MTTLTHPTPSNEIAQQLGETEPEPQAQIERALAVCGPEVVQALLQETLTIEAQGGLMLPDSSRRRTPGGVFFHLLRQRVSREDWSRILPPRTAIVPSTGLLPLGWDDRAEVVREAKTRIGSVSNVKLVVVGRPREVKRHETFVIATLDGGTRIPDLPKGLPAIASLPTIYKVFIALRDWRPVEAALKNPEDVMVAEGYAYPNPKARAVLILAQKIGTAGMRAARRNQRTTWRSRER